MTINTKLKAPKKEKSLSPLSFSLEAFSQDGSDGVDGEDKERKVRAMLKSLRPCLLWTLCSFFFFFSHRQLTVLRREPTLSVSFAGRWSLRSGGEAPQAQTREFLFGVVWRFCSLTVTDLLTR